MRVVLVVVAIVFAVTTGGAQQPIVRDPHLRPPVVEEPRYVLIDDMLIATDQFSRVTARPQGALLDFRTASGYWDFGVIPYQISPAFTERQRQNIVAAIEGWMTTAPVVFVRRTTEFGYLDITRDAPSDTQPSSCFSAVGQFRRGTRVVTNLGDNCADSLGTTYHELGHLLGLYHEHSRADRDDYVEINLANVPANAHFAFNKLTFPVYGPYDFGSVMHYSALAFAIDRSKPVIIPRPGWVSAAANMGQRVGPSNLDHSAVAFLYNGQLRASAVTRATESPRRTFSRDDFLLAMERLNNFYRSRYGLNREQGLSVGGRPDFLGIAQWIFDVYLGARSAGWSADGAFDIVTAALTRSEEWRQKNPGRAPLTPAPFQATVAFDRNEFLSVMQQLDAFYRAPEGLQRPEGLSLNGGPDFLGLATWVFDVYLSERLRGTSANAAWVLTQNAIRATDEWRRKH